MLKSLMRSRERGLRLDVLWLIAVLAAVLFLTSLVPTPPNDFWWHLRIGQIIYDTGTIPVTNMFGWSVPSDTPFVYGAWLSELILYALYHLGGWSLVIFSRNLLWGGALVLVAIEAHRRSGSWRLSALAILLVFLMSFNNLIVRPQDWSWIPFALFVWLLGRYVHGQLRWQALLICPLVMTLWVNLHGAFVLGILLLGTYLVGETIARLLRRPDACSWREIRYLGIVTLLTVIATFVNPRGVGSLSYVVDMMTNKPSQGLVVEWQSPTPTGGANTFFYAILLASMLLLWLSRRAPRPTDVLLMLGFTWMAWSGMRYVIWFGMVSMPMVVQMVADLVPNRRWLVSPVKNHLNLLMASGFLIAVLLVQPWFVERLIPRLPTKYREFVLVDNPVGPLLGVDTPIGVVDYLAANPRDHVFNEMGYGSYFIWALPDLPVFVDPRVELYPLTIWEDYRDISHGIRYSELLAKYGVKRLVIDTQMQEGLAESLLHDEGWALVYEDHHTQVWDSVAPTIAAIPFIN